MKKYYLFVVACLAAMSLSAQQYTMHVTQTNGKTLDIPVDGVESVTFVEIPDTAVDLGLSVKWAAFNIGATKPEERGGYFSWGETSPKNVFYWKNYAHLDEKSDMLSIGADISGTQYDAAKAQWGDKWRMPTREEFIELNEKCDWQWTTFNGIKGMQVSSRTNGNSIFLPITGYCIGTNERELGYTTDNPLGLETTGYYWTSTIQLLESGEYQTKGTFSYLIFFSAGDPNHARYNLWYRYGGIPIRPVTDK